MSNKLGNSEPNFQSSNNSLNKDISIVISILHSGHSIELPASGFSMFPTLRPGDKLLVSPFNKCKLPEPGSIIVALRHNILIMHRLIEILKDSEGNNLFVTRGDSTLSIDPHWKENQVIGIAVSYKRKGKEYEVRRQILTNKQLLLNRMVLWFWFRINGVEMRMKGKNSE